MFKNVNYKGAQMCLKGSGRRPATYDETVDILRGFIFRGDQKNVGKYLILSLNPFSKQVSVLELTEDLDIIQGAVGIKLPDDSPAEYSVVGIIH